jgi:hypothetical protein
LICQVVVMWTRQQRRKQKVARARQQQGYPTDLEDEEWRLIEPLLLSAALKTRRLRRPDDLLITVSCPGTPAKAKTPQ